VDAFFGFRQRWMMAGEAAGALACGLFSYWWMENHKAAPAWIATRFPPAWARASLLPLSSVMAHARDHKFPLPLGEGQGEGRHRRAHGNPSIGNRLARPFSRAVFLRLLAFGCWLSFSTGLTQTVQGTFPVKVLHLSLLTMLAMQPSCVWPVDISPAIWRRADRIGNSP